MNDDLSETVWMLEYTSLLWFLGAKAQLPGPDFLKPAKSGVIIYDLQRDIGDRMDHVPQS